MAFDDLIRTGVALADSLTGSLQATVTHEAWIGSDEFGKASFATGVGRPAIVERRNRERQMSDGRTILTTAKITFLRPIPANGATGRKEPIDSRDRLTLPDGSTDPVADVEALVDPDTGRGYYAVVYLGRAT